MRRLLQAFAAGQFAVAGVAAFAEAWNWAAGLALIAAAALAGAEGFFGD